MKEDWSSISHTTYSRCCCCVMQRTESIPQERDGDMKERTLEGGDDLLIGSGWEWRYKNIDEGCQVVTAPSLQFSRGKITTLHKIPQQLNSVSLKVSKSLHPLLFPREGKQIHTVTSQMTDNVSIIHPSHQLHMSNTWNTRWYVIPNPRDSSSHESLRSRAWGIASVCNSEETGPTGCFCCCGEFSHEAESQGFQLGWRLTLHLVAAKHFPRPVATNSRAAAAWFRVICKWNSVLTQLWCSTWVRCHNLRESLDSLGKLRAAPILLSGEIVSFAKQWDRKPVEWGIQSEGTLYPTCPYQIPALSAEEVPKLPQWGQLSRATSSKPFTTTRHKKGTPMAACPCKPCGSSLRYLPASKCFHLAMLYSQSSLRPLARKRPCWEAVNTSARSSLLPDDKTSLCPLWNLACLWARPAGDDDDKKKDPMSKILKRGSPSGTEVKVTIKIKRRSTLTPIPFYEPASPLPGFHRYWNCYITGGL